MRESTRGLLVIVATLAVGVVTYVFFLGPYIGEENQVDKVLTAKSTWTVTMQEYDLSGRISAETYRLVNDNGKTTMFYSATDRNGTLKFFNVPLEGPEGTFLFQSLVAEGIWELDDKPVRPRPKDEYVIVVEQTLGDEGGSRAFGFSDPHYWATTNARELMLRLPKTGTIGGRRTKTFDVSGGRPLRDDRYLKIVQMIKQFGPPSVRQAENQIRYDLLNARQPKARAAKVG